MIKILKIVAIAFSWLFLGCTALAKQQTFETFWSDFRRAALAGDYVTLTSLTQFPLEVRSVDDNTPANLYSAEQLPKIFPQLMNQSVFQYETDNLETSTLKEVLRRKAHENVDHQKTHHRVEQFEFKKIEGKWYLVRAYLEG